VADAERQRTEGDRLRAQVADLAAQVTDALARERTLAMEAFAR
jgi:hypothetical protein